MGYRLQMSAEIYDWLADLRDSDPPAAVLAGQALAALAEERLTAASQREQMRADAFRTRKEVLKAAYTAARAVYLIEQAQGQDTGDDSVPQDDPVSPAAGAAASLAEITGQIERELGLEGLAEGLMELRPGAPADAGIRILFAVEPPGAALLIAVLGGREAVRDHYREAVLLASGVLREARAGQAAGASARAFGDARSFLEEFFPGRADELRSGAAALAAASRAGEHQLQAAGLVRLTSKAAELSGRSSRHRPERSRR